MKSAMKSASESALDSWNLKASEDLSEDTWSSIDGSCYGSDFEAWGLDESSWFDLRGGVGGGQAAAKRQKFEQSVLSLKENLQGMLDALGKIEQTGGCLVSLPARSASCENKTRCDLQLRFV